MAAPETSLDPDAARFLERLRAAGAPPLSTLTPEQARAAHVAGSAAVAGVAEPVHAVTDVDADGVPVRVYSLDASRGTIVYLHGGGWVVGTLDTYDHVCRALALASHSTVVAVDYALAPERRHPFQVEQCATALAWAARRESGPVRLAGDSAGAHLAALVTARTDVELAGLALVYPVVSPGLDTVSAQENATGYGLETEGMRWYWEQYLPQEQTDLPVDLRELDLSRFPPTLVLTAGFDPLRDEGLELADRLEQAGVAVRRLSYPGQIHGFFRTTGVIPEGHEAHEEVGRYLARLG